MRSFRGVAQFGSVRALGAWGQGFKSLHPDHLYVAPWSSGLRHRPFTAVTWVRVPYGSPAQNPRIPPGMRGLLYLQGFAGIGNSGAPDWISAIMTSYDDMRDAKVTTRLTTNSARLSRFRKRRFPYFSRYVQLFFPMMPSTPRLCSSSTRA